MHNSRTRKLSASLKGSDAAIKGFPKGTCPPSERKLRSSAQKRLDRTRSNSETICGYMTSSEVETHARRLGTEDSENARRRTETECGRARELTPPLALFKTLTQTRLTKNSPLQQTLPWRCTRPQSFQHGSFAWCLEDPVATLMQRTDHLRRLAGALQIVSNPADRRVKVSNSKLRSHSWKKQKRAPEGTRTRTRSSADRPPLTGG